MVVRYVTQSSCENGCFFEPITCILHILLWFYIYILHFIRCCWQNWKYKAWYNMFACLHVYICIYMVKKQTKISYLLGLKFTNRNSSRFFFFSKYTWKITSTLYWLSFNTVRCWLYNLTNGKPLKIC